MTDLVLVNKRVDEETDRGGRGCSEAVDRHGSKQDLSVCTKQDNTRLINEADKRLGEEIEHDKQ